MTTNAYEVIDMVTREALLVLKNKLGLGNRVLRQYDGSFGVEGAKIGDTLRIRKPIRVNATSGAGATAQNFIQTMVPVAAQDQNNVIFNFTTKDLELDILSFSEQCISPVMSQLATTIDSQGFAAVIAGTVTTTGPITAYNGTYPGFQNLATPGNISATAGPAAWTGAVLGSAATDQYGALIPFLQAQARLGEQAAPTEDRYIAINPACQAATMGRILSAFNPQQEISKAFEEGTISTLAGARWFVSPNVPTFTAGAWTQATTCQVNVTSINGATTLVVKGFGAGDTVVVGDQFVVAGVHSVNPLNRVSTQNLQVFTIIGGLTNDGSGNFTFAIAPTINSSTAPQYQTTDTLPQAAARITMMGTSAATTAVNIMYQKQAVVMVNAPLADVSDAGALCVRIDNPEDKLSLRYVKQYQASSDTVVDRIDILTGWMCTRPELGCRISA